MRAPLAPISAPAPDICGPSASGRGGAISKSRTIGAQPGAIYCAFACALERAARGLRYVTLRGRRAGPGRRRTNLGEPIDLIGAIGGAIAQLIVVLVAGGSRPFASRH